jgi:hypothetical protein
MKHKKKQVSRRLVNKITFNYIRINLLITFEI